MWCKFTIKTCYVNSRLLCQFSTEHTKAVNSIFIDLRELSLLCALLQTSTRKSFSVTALFDTEVDITHFQHGGLLRYVARTLLWETSFLAQFHICSAWPRFTSLIGSLVSLQHGHSKDVIAQWSNINCWCLCLRAAWVSWNVGPVLEPPLYFNKMLQ